MKSTGCLKAVYFKLILKRFFHPTEASVTTRRSTTNPISQQFPKMGYQAWEVIENQQGRVEVKVPDSDWHTIMNGLVDELIWDPIAGDTLLITLQDGSLYAAPIRISLHA